MADSSREQKKTRWREPKSLESVSTSAPLPMEVQRKRRRIVRIVAALTIVAGIGLSLVPLPHSMERDGNGHSHGFPFRSMTFGSGEKQADFNLRLGALAGNIGVAAIIAVGLSLFARRRSHLG